MRAVTAILVVVFFALLATAGIYGVVQVVDDGGTLTEEWVSDTARDTTGNHHAPAVAQIENETAVLVPVNAVGDNEDCALIVFTMELEEQWRVTTDPAECNIHTFGDPTVADLDSDGDDEVFVATTEEVVHAYELETGEHVFSRNLTGIGYAEPIVTDFTPSEGRELIVADLNGGVFVFNSTGETLWTQDVSTITAPLFVNDFDGDGTDELAIGEGDNVTILEPDGTLAQQTDIGGRVIWMTIGQADDDGAVEVIAATLDGRVVTVDGQSGSIEWEQKYERRAAVYAFGDGDADSQAEVYAVAEDGRLRALDASDGTEEWTTRLTTEDVPMMPPPALGDLTGDGNLELVAVSNDGVVSVVDPSSGEITDSYSRDIPIFMRPTLADLDGDGTLEILVVYGDGRVAALSYTAD